MEVICMSNFEEFLAEQLKDDEFRREYEELKPHFTIVTYSPAYASLRGGGFSLKYSNLYSINELSPCVPRL